MNVVNVVPLPFRIMASQSDEPHISVLRREVVEALAPRAGGVYVDATLGAGGHAEAILAVPGTRLVGIDRDTHALGLARARLASSSERFVGRQARFSEIAAVLAELGLERVDGIVADLGISSMQLDDAARGLSFRENGPLDMRMDPSAGETARELAARLSDEELTAVILRYGEERRARRVARCIKQALERGELETTLDLRRAVIRAVGPNRTGGVDPATRTFQALRIAVNEELTELEALLAAAVDLLAPGARAAGERPAQGGTLAVIAFHSLEDRMVKRALGERTLWQPLFKKPVMASAAECEANPRARSAKLRAARRLSLSLAAPPGTRREREAPEA
ncbi:MAG: 16S rRNA (cytosine(1402)-N(4))-methyltransferase RsmH [Myxococcales bacterium]|nr:16S rRNA (cytosine(1402)-N(4))-methyltransferase RsmH [Myxococcales bacterium]